LVKGGPADWGGKRSIIFLKSTGEKETKIAPPEKTKPHGNRNGE